MTFSVWTRSLTAGAALAAVAIGPAMAETTFMANSFYNEAHPLSQYGYVQWAQIVEELSGGDLVPEVFTGTVLLAPRANLQGISDNIVQVAHHAAVYTPSELPVANAVQELGFNYSDPLVAIFAVAEFSIENPLQQEEWQEHGLVYLGAYSTPAYILFCRDPVRTLDEIRGVRVRTAGSTVSQWVEAVGGIPVNVPSSEMYTGLERGTLDCASNAPSDLIARSLHEVAEHTTLLPTGMYWSGPHWGYNADFWADLTSDQRAILMEATARSMARMNINYIAEGEEALAQAVALGGNVYEPGEDLIRSVESYREQALERVYVTARETYGIEDAEALIDDFRSYYAKWEELLATVDRTDEDALTALAMQEIYSELDPASYGVYQQ